MSSDQIATRNFYLKLKKYHADNRIHDVARCWIEMELASLERDMKSLGWNIPN